MSIDAYIILVIYIIDVSNCGYPYVDVKDQLYFGAVQAGGISNGKYFGASDNRRLCKVSIYHL